MERVGIGGGEALPPLQPRGPEQARGTRGEREAGTLRPARRGPSAAGIASGLRTHKVTAGSQPSHQGPPAASYRWTAPLQAPPQPFPQSLGLRSSVGVP